MAAAGGGAAVWLGCRFLKNDILRRNEMIITVHGDGDYSVEH